MDLVVVGFELGFEGFEVLAVEDELFVFGFWFGDGLALGAWEEGLRWVEGMLMVMMMRVVVMVEICGR